MTLLSSVCRSNLGILRQKTGLIDTLVSRHGSEKAAELFSSVCPFVGASIGQHMRHSMDHVELAVLVAASVGKESGSEPPEIHYDLRIRGGLSEHDIEEAKKRILNVTDVLHTLSETTTAEESIVLEPVKANFFLSGDESDEFPLSSTVGRELGFAAHHGIHHMALIRLIALGHAGLSEDDLPSDFGRAPSTIHYDRFLQSKN